MNLDEIEACGLGLPKSAVKLERTVPEWAVVADALIGEISDTLGAQAAAIEHVGSTSVPGLMAKPIVDIAVLLAPGVDVDVAVTAMETLGYEFRGDAGSSGGLVFVLSVRPLHRVAHVHIVLAGDAQWDYYLVFRDRLRRDAWARADYERTKLALAAAYPEDRVAYTDGKDDVVRRWRTAT